MAPPAVTFSITSPTTRVMTATRAWILGLVLVTAGLAGCLGGDDEGDPADPAAEDDPLEDDNETEQEGEPEDVGPNVTTTWFNSSVQGQSLPGTGPFCVSACDNSMTFQVPNGTTGLLVELAWEADASMMLDVDVPSEECQPEPGGDCPPEQTSGGEGLLEVRLTDESQIPAGEWSASVWAEDSPSEAVAFTLAATTFVDGEMPRQFSQVEQG